MSTGQLCPEENNSSLLRAPRGGTGINAISRRQIQLGEDSWIICGNNLMAFY